MFEELNSAIDAYQGKWLALVTGRNEPAFFNALRPTAVGWKVASRTEYDKLFALWHDACDYIFEVWMNDRYVAKMRLKEELHWGVPIVKLMQRRPGSVDPPGLDHVDFYCKDSVTASDLRAKEPDLRWADEVNGPCTWTSLWFDGVEAKLRDDTVLRVAANDLLAAERHILHL